MAFYTEPGTARAPRSTPPDGEAAVDGLAQAIAAGASPAWLPPGGDAARPFAQAMREALQHRPHVISPKFFYDAAGSRLFDRICDLPEYYPTRTEVALLGRHAAEMASLIGPGAELVEFGAGSTTKIRLLLDALQRPCRFVPIDISAEHLRTAAAALQRDHAGLVVQPLAADFTQPLTLPAWPDGAPAGPVRRVGFFPGSSIGNFTPDEARGFLRRTAALLRGGGLLIGVDLVKDPALLHAAYNDAAGVTAAFNRNLLHRANRELGTGFDADGGFDHYAFYEPRLQRIEMHLVSRHRQTVRLGPDTFLLDEGETLHTENSQKFTVEGFRRLAVEAGYGPGPVWCDPQRLFSVHWLEARP